MKFTSFALPMTAILGANGLLSAQAPNPSLTFSGGPGSIPAGTASATYDAYDEDVFSDDKLVLGAPVSIAADGWTTGVLPLECVGGVVQGPAGTSGEQSATVYVIIKFWDSHGQLIGTLTTGTKGTKC
ncbi:MAG: hypothetical protein KF830_12870 [Planctomycetes bacterium]|nr:hypothetical protein [Planctomycetota bacterium]